MISQIRFYAVLGSHGTPLADPLALCEATRAVVWARSKLRRPVL